jgi:hypothetical protein
MLSHVEMFSVYTAAILDKLYENFPITIEIKAENFVERFNTANLLQKMRESVSAIPYDPTSFARVNQGADNLDKVSELVRNDQINKDVFRGTIEFLIAEGHVRSNDPYPEDALYRGCQLTAKGFSHLHKEFKDKALSDESSTIIQWIKGRFASSSSIEGALVVGVITKFLG